MTIICIQPPGDWLGGYVAGGVYVGVGGGSES